MIKECPECEQAMQGLVTGLNPKASEWCCVKCHISVLMEPDEHVVEMAKKQQQKARQQTT